MKHIFTNFGSAPFFNSFLIQMMNDKVMLTLSLLVHCRVPVCPALIWHMNLAESPSRIVKVRGLTVTTNGITKEEKEEEKDHTIS